MPNSGAKRLSARIFTLTRVYSRFSKNRALSSHASRRRSVANSALVVLEISPTCAYVTSLLVRVEVFTEGRVTCNRMHEQ
jgi:hypothetical protein